MAVKALPLQLEKAFRPGKVMVRAKKIDNSTQNLHSLSVVKAHVLHLTKIQEIIQQWVAIILLVDLSPKVFHNHQYR